MAWLVGGETASEVAEHLGRPTGGDAEALADLRLVFASGCVGRAHLSWRAAVRRTSAVIYGERAMVEIEGDRVTLTSRNGLVEDLSVADAADDSYHSAWFGAMAAEFERAIGDGPDSQAARDNIGEARAAVATIQAMRNFARSGGTSVKIL